MEKEIYSLQERLQTEISSIKNRFGTKVIIEDSVAQHAVETSKKFDSKSESIQNSIKSLKQELSESQRYLKTIF